MTNEELKVILNNHKLWLDGKEEGVRANLEGANLEGANLGYANLMGANLRGANLSDADLSGADLSGADLSDADLSGADFSLADLDYANLSDTDLRYANLEGAKLKGAILEYADLRRADLRCADLRRANLEGADLKGAYLKFANLMGANLRGANLSDATLLCFGNMKEIRTMQIDTWEVGYTADTLQIGFQRHPIDKWRKWNTEAGRKWIEQMDNVAFEWADRNLGLVLQIIDANPAAPTGHEAALAAVSETHKLKGETE